MHLKLQVMATSHFLPNGKLGLNQFLHSLRGKYGYAGKDHIQST